jgi:hypothetical protein
MKIKRLFAAFALTVALLGGTSAATADEKPEMGPINAALGSTTVSGFTGGSGQYQSLERGGWWSRLVSWFGGGSQRSADVPSA